MEAIYFIMIFGLLAEDVISTEIAVTTGDVYDYTYLEPYGLTASSREIIVFAVKACGHAHTALMSNRRDNKGLYDIGIGGWDNERSFIRSEKQGTALIFYYSSELSCALFKVFWIGWSNGVISVGRGMTVDKDTFMEYDFGTLNPINYLAISTGWNATGEWLFNLEYSTTASTTSLTITEGVSATLPGTYEYTTEDIVDSGQEASTLTAPESSTTTSTTSFTITEGVSATLPGTHEYTTEDIVDSGQEASTLTAPAADLGESYAEDDFVELGKNCDLSSSISSSTAGTLIQCCAYCAMHQECRCLSCNKDTDQCYLHSFTSSGCTSTNGDWLVMKRTVKEQARHPCSFNTGDRVVSLKGQCGYSYLKSPLMFTIRACNYARIDLRSEPSEQYLVDLGDTTFIRFTSGNSSDDSPYISGSLNCDTHLPFWITMEQRDGRTTIQYGRGETVGTDLISSREDSWNMTFIDAMISTQGGNNGSWTFYEN